MKSIAHTFAKIEFGENRVEEWKVESWTSENSSAHLKKKMKETSQQQSLTDQEKCGVQLFLVGTRAL